MELQNFRSSSFSTDGAIYIPKAAITLGEFANVEPNHWPLLSVTFRRLAMPFVGCHQNIVGITSADVTLKVPLNSNNWRPAVSRQVFDMCGW